MTEGVVTPRFAFQWVARLSRSKLKAYFLNGIIPLHLPSLGHIQNFLERIVWMGGGA
jgi:hypothetical protein